MASLSEASAALLRGKIDEYIARPNGIPGLVCTIVNKDGTRLFDYAAGRRGSGLDKPLDTDAIFWLASCTKLITSIAGMQLVEQKRLSLDDSDQLEIICPPSLRSQQPIRSTGPLALGASTETCIVEDNAIEKSGRDLHQPVYDTVEGSSPRHDDYKNQVHRGWNTVWRGVILALQLQYNLKRDEPSPQWDWTDPVYGKFAVMILLAGISLAIDQMAVMWILGAFSNEPRLLARYGGFFKAMLSAGLCLAFGLEAGSVSYVAQTAVQGGGMILSFPVLFYLVFRCVSDTNYFAEEGVIPPQSVGTAPKFSAVMNDPEDAGTEKTYGMETSGVVELEERVTM
ncbi:uncharacterized protein Aud_009345 [Aspergillus udagawae]|uniref:Beta-lactamase-related domain-containing protein n=1 Tax=Aspergillus udagawae TaxID=91492 RepID=A0A8E0QYM3_9EURO|nr:uncharacterized protein Aud_009345 [Aspergillus udagawae]GIC92870.1 hypothetical protein Aud_009345 [Aspergillus udagawae]